MKIFFDIYINYETFKLLLWGMFATGLIVFVALYFTEAGYGRFFNSKWGPAINNKVAWFAMEVPVFLAMTMLWLRSERQLEVVPLIFFFLFQLHYFQRSFIFPLLLRGHKKMPITIVLLGVTFNVVNAIMQGGWIFYIAPEYLYTRDWLSSWQFVLGTVIFFSGLYINMQSDHIIRNLRDNGEKDYHIPKGGLFKYVSSANYFGEFIEWVGFAILTWSAAGAIFAFWTFANLAPRANSIHKWYSEQFGEEFSRLNLKRIIPFIY
jgi:3-oxo-5-alpha-steroid 4-dehydrogenase 1